jgi:ubiquinone/menaquinone biosynthesis C-methylase UbiE
MIETTIPEISVSELMARVRTNREKGSTVEIQAKLPPIGVIREIASAVLPKPVATKTQRIADAIERAKAATTTEWWIPKPFRGLLRRQDRYNREVLRAIESLNNTNAQLADRVRHLSACIEVQDHGIQQLAELRRSDAQWMNEVARMGEGAGLWGQAADRLVTTLTEDRRKLLRTTQDLARQIAVLKEKHFVTEKAVRSVTRQTDDLGQKVESLYGRVETLVADMGHVRDQTVSFEQRFAGLSDHLTTVNRLTEQLSVQANNADTQPHALVESVRALRSEFENAAEHLRHLQAQADELKVTAVDVQRALANATEHDKHLTEHLQAESSLRTVARNDLERLEQRQTSDSAYIKAELSRQSGLIHKLLGRASSRPSGKQSRETNIELTAPAGGRLDAFYFSFENRFRGPRGEIKRRQRFYLPIVKNCGAGSRARPIVDVGCGRGEWLELLREEKFIATGVDLNVAMIDQCKERKLKVVQADAVEFLRSLPDNSHGAITGFHIIEHLPLDTLVDLIAETYRVLHPGGVVIFESPNCKNLIVGACNFYIDPTHRNPVFPETAQFVLETNGFEKVTLEYLCPADNAEIRGLVKKDAPLRELLYGPRDFGVIGYKPEPPVNGAEG